MSESENGQAVQPAAGVGGVVALYARISLDRHDGEGVTRQLEDCRALAAERWPGRPVREYVDNDLSAFRARRRPEFDRLVADLRAVKVSAVVAYHPDRLYRRLPDLEELIEAVQAAGAEVATTRAGDVDLATASGRMVARLLGAVARHESERIGERVARAKRQRAAQGRPAGGGQRPYGLTADRTALVPNEAELLRQAAASILAGTTWHRAVDELNERGYVTSAGHDWTIGTLRRVLTSPHVAGLRTYHGEIIGQATWPAVLDRGDWELLRWSASLRTRGARSVRPRRLLSGLLVCGRCLPTERTLSVTGVSGRPGKAIYRCNPAATSNNGRGCSSSIAADPMDRLITQMVLAAVDEGRLAALADTRRPQHTAAPDLAAIEADLDAVTDDHGAGRITRREWLRLRELLVRRLDEAHAALAAVRTAAEPGLAELAAGGLADRWDDLDLDRRRAIIGAVITRIVVGPAARRGQFPLVEGVGRIDVARVHVTWRA